MLTVYLALMVGAQQPPELPLARATLLRDAGCWLRWEGEVPTSQGVANFRLAAHMEHATLAVERFEKDDWRGADFSIEPPAAPSAPRPTSPDSIVSLRVSVPADAKAVKIRAQAYSTALRWRPQYTLILGDKSPKLTMRAFVTGSQPLGEAALECADASASPRGPGEDRWSDPTIYPLPTRRLDGASTSLLVFDVPVRAEEFVHVELGGMAGEPGVRPAADRVHSKIRIQNKSGKPWPTGDLLVLQEGRLSAKLLFPHTDPNRAAELALGTAVGVSVTREEIELDRKALVIRRETDAPDSIQTAGSATVTNGSGRAANLYVTKIVAGDATGASDDAKIVRVPNRLGIDQPLSEIRWTLTLAPGQSKRLTFGTTLRIPQPQEAKERP